MLRERGGACLYFSVGLILSILLPPSILYAAALAAGAAGAVTLLGTSPAAWRRAGVLLLALALGGAAGRARLLPTEMARRQAPAAGRGFTWYEGILLADTRPAASTGRGKTSLCLMRLRRGGGPEGEAAIGGRALVFISGSVRLFRGQRVRIQGRLEGAEAGRADGARWFGRAGRAAVRADGFSSAVWAWRADRLISLGRHIESMGAPASALARALLLGESDRLPAELARSFERSGSLHLLALSGLHVGVLLALVTGLLGFLPERSWRVCAGAVLAILYLILVGNRPSLSRAVVMVSAGAAGMALRREPDALNLLAFSAAILLLVDPAILRTLSFQLSYLALLGILSCARQTARALSACLTPALGRSLAASFGAGLWTAPVLLSAFGILYPVGLLAAPVLIPLVTLFMWAAVFWLPAAAVAEAPGWTFLLRPARLALEMLYRLMAGLLEICARAPGLVLERRTCWWAASGLAALAAVLAARRVGLLRYRVVSGRSAAGQTDARLPWGEPEEAGPAEVGGKAA